jgi:hypothetical protein
MSFTDKIADLVVNRIEKGKNSKGISENNIKSEVSLDTANTINTVKTKTIDKAKVKSDKQKAKEEQALLRKQKQEEDKAIGSFIFEWRRLMSHLGLENELDETFHMTNIKIENYGYKCNIHSAVGLSLSQLESDGIKNAIESHFKCLLVMKLKRGYIETQFITIDIPEVPYKFIKTEPWQLYLATSIEEKPVFGDMIKFPHLVIQGATGMGKTKMIDCALVNLIKSNDPQDVSLYFLQADKPDQIVYRKCKHTKAYAETLEEILATTNYIIEVIESRAMIFKPLIEDGIAENIYVYNQLKQYRSRKLNYIYIVVDEYSTLMPNDGDEPYKKLIKNMIQANMERIIQVGRYVGALVVIGLQRATIDKLPSFIKANCNTIASFHVNNEKSSFVAIDSNEATTLNPREAIIKTVDKQICKTVTLSQADIVSNVKPYRWSDALYTNFKFDSWIKTEELKRRAYGKKYKPAPPKKPNKSEKNNNSNDENPNTQTSPQPDRVPLGATYIGNEIEEPKKSDLEVKKIEDTPIETKKEELKTEETSIKPTNDELNFISKKTKKTPFFFEDWKDPSENCKVIDKTIISNSEISYIKPKSKGDESNGIEREG